MTGFRFNEKYLSQIPALQLLLNLGYEYLPPEQALKESQGKPGNVLQLSDEQGESLFSGEFAPARAYFEAQQAEGERPVTEQDRAIYSLCQPERLLELARC
jgi:hypothetical protein